MVILLQLCLFLIAVIWRGRYLFGKHLKTVEGTPHLSYVSEGKHGINARHVGLQLESCIPFIIKRERWYHSLLKAIGIATEITLPHSEFDKQYFIMTDHPGHLEQAVASGKLMDQLQALFALPVKSLHATGDKIWCVIKKEDLHINDAHYAQHFNLLEGIARACSPSEQGAWTVVVRNLGILALLCICVHTGLLTMGVLGVIPTQLDSIDTIEVSHLVTKGIVAGSLVAILWLVVLFSVFKRTSWICWVFADFLLCGIIGFALSGVEVVREANIRLPQPAAQVYEQPLVGKSCVLECKKRCGKRCTRRSSYPLTTANCDARDRESWMQQKKAADSICRNSAWYDYTLVSKSWRNAGNYSFSPTVTLFDQSRVGSYLAIPVNQGALGIEWVDTESIEAK